MILYLHINKAKCRLIIFIIQNYFRQRVLFLQHKTFINTPHKLTVK